MGAEILFFTLYRTYVVYSKLAKNSLIISIKMSTIKKNHKNKKIKASLKNNSPINYLKVINFELCTYFLFL